MRSAACSWGVGTSDQPQLCACLHLRARDWACVRRPGLGAIVPDIVSKDELSSAITLGGVQLNVAAIVGPFLAGFVLPLLGAPLAHFS